MIAGRIILSLIIPVLCLAVTIRRDEIDSMYGAVTCKENSSCVCKPSSSTIMSNDGIRSSCQTPEMLGCGYAVMRTRQAFLFSEERNRIRVSQGLKQSCSQIRQIYVWNLDPSTENGNWIDITDDMKRYFSLTNEKKQPWDAYLFVSEAKMKLLSGHLLKIVFGSERCENCLIAKARGNKTYPVDVTDFKTYFVTPTTKETSSLISTRKIMTKAMVPTTIMTTKAVVPTTKTPDKILITVVPVTTRKAATTIVTKVTHIPSTEPRTVVIATMEHTQKTKSNIAATHGYPHNKDATNDTSVTMTALISGVFAVLTVALFLLILFCRRRYRNDSKLRSKADLMSGEGGHDVGTSTKSRSWEWDAVKLLPNKSPAPSRSTSHYENFELEPTKYDEITKEYDFDNYECIFGTNGNVVNAVVTSDDDGALRSPEYAEICPEYENYNSMEESNKNSKGKKQRSKSSVREKQMTSPHKYSEIAVYDSFDIKHGQSSEEVKHNHPHQYAEIDIIDNDGRCCPKLNRELSTKGHDEIVSPRRYEEIDLGNDNTQSPRDEQNNKQYDRIVIDNENSVIKSAKLHELQDKINNNPLSSDATISDKEFSNPFYEEHLMITPGTRDHSYENNPVNVR